nr:phage portal protein [Bradyrhizobium japonicum]
MSTKAAIPTGRPTIETTSTDSHGVPDKARATLPRRHAAKRYGRNRFGYLWSPDAELNMYRDRIVSRVRDIVRNDGWASGAITRVLDNAIGPMLRPIPKPDYRWLQMYTGIKGFDHEWAKDYARAVDANWRSWAADVGKWCDAGRNLNFGQMAHVALRHKLVDGDTIAVMKWLPGRVGYQNARRDFHAEQKFSVGNARVPIMFPGEKINILDAKRPSANFGQFEAAVLRNVAAGTGLSTQQISNNWSDVNYSSARGALLEAWKTIDRRRDEFTTNWAAPIRCCVMEEMHAFDELPLPAGAPDFIECRTAYSRARWLGAPRGWIDPTSEAQAAILRMDGALSTLEDEAASQGLDFEEVLEQRRYEIGLFEEYGIPLPEWSGKQDVPASRQTSPK